jgi:hypothetical protein
MLLQLDVADFFPSVDEARVRAAFERLGASKAMSELLTQLTTLEEELPQGAPTSVAVGDLVLFGLDRRLAGFAKKHGFTYTRYVDDLTLSGGGRLEGFEGHVREIVRDEGWTLNEKGGIVGPGERHALLGAVVNQKPNVSREYFGQVRSYLRQVAKGGVVVTREEFTALEAKVKWILSVNPERERVLRPLLAEVVIAMKGTGTASPRSDESAAASSA